MAQITRLNIRRHRRADRYLYAGDRLDRQLPAGIIANQTAEDHIEGAAMQAYGRIFAQIGWGAAGCSLAVIAVLGGWWLLTRRRARTVNA